MAADIVVMYVLVRGDLIKKLNWPIGAVIAQACHASTAIIHLFCDDPHTKKYTDDLNRMHKIVLEVSDEEALNNLSSTLKEAKVDHKLWIEQPENIPTCLAIKPYPKDAVQAFVKKFKLYK